MEPQVAILRREYGRCSGRGTFGFALRIRKVEVTTPAQGAREDFADVGLFSFEHVLDAVTGEIAEPSLARQVVTAGEDAALPRYKERRAVNPAVATLRFGVRRTKETASVVLVRSVYGNGAP